LFGGPNTLNTPQAQPKWPFKVNFTLIIGEIENMADLKDLLKDFSNIEKDIKRTLNNRLLLKDIARTLTKEIKKRIQDGYGIDNTTNKLKKFKVLKQSTIKYREKQKEKGKKILISVRYR